MKWIGGGLLALVLLAALFGEDPKEDRSQAVQTVEENTVRTDAAQATEERTEDRIKLAEARAARAEKQLAEEREARRRADRRAARRRAAAKAALEDLVYCDANIRVTAGSVTCPFAQNTFLAVYRQGASNGLSVYSPALERRISVDCGDSGANVRCSTAAGGTVLFPRSALAAYTADDAEAYERSNDVGDETPSQESAPDEDYSDVVNCSDTSATDFPTPPGDPNGLDRDNDGVACES